MCRMDWNCSQQTGYGSQSGHARIRLAAACCVLLAVACGRGPDAEDSTPKHLVLVTIDTLRADHVGAYGYSRETTANIDT